MAREWLHPAMPADISAAERDAYVRGDIRTAEILAALMDAESSAQQAEKRADTTESEWQDKYDRVQEAWGTHNEEMRQRIDNLRQLVDQAARVSGREMILERMDEMEAFIDKAEGAA